MATPNPLFLFRDSTDPVVFHTAVWGRVFNHRRDHSRVPFAVCKPRTVDDVVAAVDLATKHNCRVSVRSGGHSWAAWSVRQNAVLVDLIDLDADLPPSTSTSSTGDETFKSEVDGGRGGGGGRMDYDERTKIVSCPPATTGRMLNGFLATVEGGKGRIFAGGHCPDVGLGGFLLQGGMGWNCKNWGWACESVVAIDMVTADGRRLYCSIAENPDLFWAARGAGPGFPAIVTRFHLLTRPLLQMFQSLYVFPILEYKTVLQWEIDLAPTLDPSTEMVAVSSYLPLSPSSPPTLTILANFTTFQPTLSHAQAALTPIHTSLPPNTNPAISLFCQPTSLEKEYIQQSTTYPQQFRYCADNLYLPNDNTDVPGLLEQAFTTLKGEKSCALWFSMNPTSRRQLDGSDMALSLQSDHYFAVYGIWEDEREDDEYEAWVRGVMKGVERHSVGSYLGDADFRGRGTRYWGDEAGRRLMKVRREWDPRGRICGFLDGGDRSGVDGLGNCFGWEGEGENGGEGESG